MATKDHYDMDELGRKLYNKVEERAKVHMPAPVQIDIVDGSLQFSAGWGWGKIQDRYVKVVIFGPYDLRTASAAAPYTIWALPPNAESPSEPYFMVGIALNGSEGSRLPRIYGYVDDTLSYV